MVYRLDRPLTSVIGHFSRSKGLSRTAMLTCSNSRLSAWAALLRLTLGFRLYMGGTRDAGHAMDLMDSP